MSRTINRLSNLFLLCLSVLSLVALFSESFGCRREPSLTVWLILGCVFLWVAASFRRGILLGMPLSAALLFFASRYYRTSPALQLQDLADRITGVFFNSLSESGPEYPYLNAVSSHSLVLLFAGFLLAALLITALSSRNMRLPLVLLETLPIFLACALVNDKAPALPVCGVLLFWFLLFAQGGGYQEDGTLGRTLLAALLPVSLLLGVLLLFYGPGRYQVTDYDRRLKLRLEQGIHSFDLLLGFGEGEGRTDRESDEGKNEETPRSRFQPSWDTADRGMELRSEFDRETARLPVLQLRAETAGKLYLRSLSYGDYCGTGWLPAEELQSGSSLPLAAFAAAESPLSVRRELVIYTQMDLDSLCVPYFAAISTGSDAFVSAAGQSDYRLQYFDYRGPYDALRLPSDVADAEVRYREYAHSVYTRLPEETRQAALQICREAGLAPEDPELIDAVAAFVQQRGEYDLSTPPYDSEDYAISFLTEERRGYCIHFATAAAVLYRSLGVPARVAGGFAVSTVPNELTEVRAGDSHAWVEVYRDGLGWIPVEVTRPGDGASLPAAPSPSVGGQSTPETAEPQGGNGPIEIPGQTEDGESPAAAEESNTEESSFSRWLLLLLLLPGLAALAALWYLLARARFLGLIHGSSGKRTVLACWRYARRASSFGGEIPALIVQTAEKATFSLHGISREEAELCRAELQKQLEDIYPRLSPVEKLKFRFLYGLR